MRTLVSGLRCHGEHASNMDIARAYAMLVELSVTLEEHAKERSEPRSCGVPS